MPLFIRLFCLTLVIACAPVAHAGQARGPIISNVAVPNDIARETETVEEAFAPPEGPYADLPMLAAPVAENGRLAGYAFVRPRLHLAAGTDDALVHDNAHMILDRFVRIAHAHPFERAGAGFDSEASHAALLDAAREMVGAARVDSLELLGGDIRAMRR